LIWSAVTRHRFSKLSFAGGLVRLNRSALTDHEKAVTSHRTPNMADDATRDRVRALCATFEQAAPAEFDATTPPQPAVRFVNALGANNRTAITRDESAKLVITEDDVRGLERDQSCASPNQPRLTPLAADIIKERGIRNRSTVPAKA